MQKNRFKMLILALFCGIFLTIPSLSFAEEAKETHPCSKEEVDNALKTARDEAKQSLNDMVDSANRLNSDAGSYISSCNPEIKPSQKKLYPSERQLAVAQFVGRDISDDNIYQYSDINWYGENPTSSGCLSSLNRVRGAYDKFVNKYKTAMLHLGTVDPDAFRCSCDENGEATECVAMDAAKEQVMEKNGKCYPFTAYHQKFASCPLCKIFEVILTTNAQIAHIAWNAVSGPLAKTVGIFFLVLLALESLKAVSAIAGTKISAYLKNVLTLGLKISITIMLLSNSGYIYKLFISPVIEGGLDMGMAVAQASGAGAECATTNSGMASIPSQEFSSSLFDSVLNTVRCFGFTASMTPAVGQGIMCHGWKDGILPKLNVWLTGLIMFIFGVMIWLAISFYLLDCTVQLGMLSALVPLFIACWPFGLTKNYTAKGVKMFMNTFFNYAVMGCVLLLGTIIINHSVTGDGNTDIQAFIDALNNNNIDKLKSMASLDGMQILTLIACSIFALKLIGTANDIADQFSKGAGGEIGNKIGGVAANAATNVAKGAARTTVSAAGTLGGKVMQAAGVTGAAQAVKGAVQRGHQAVWRGAGKAVGLGKFQGQMTGSGITPPSGTTSPTGETTSPSDGSSSADDRDEADTTEATEKSEE